MQMHLDYAGAHKIGADDPPKHGLIAIGSLPRAFLFAARSGAKLSNTITPGENPHLPSFCSFLPS